MESKYLHAYTILEVVIIMSIIVVMMGLGISGLVNFKKNAEFNSSYTSLVTNIRSIQNRARNSVSEDSGATPSDYYGIFFTTNSYVSYRCNINGTGGLSCTKSARLFEDTSLLNSTFQLGTCRNVLFQRLTGRIYSTTYTGTLGASIVTVAPSKPVTPCQINLNSQTGDQRTIIFNLITNQISFE